MPDLDFINSCDKKSFVETLGEVIEDSPWVAGQVFGQRPFASLADLHKQMFVRIMDSGEAQQIGILQAHPELAGKAAKAGELTKSSTAEQKGAGLVDLSVDEIQRIDRLNAAYLVKFGFPFIIAVRLHTKTSIFLEFERRLANTREQELITAIRQVGLIAKFRLESLFGSFE